MELFSRVIGSGQPLIIIHGLFGMSDNWQSLAKQFSAFFEVHLIDQRNHGRSFHNNDFSYQSLSQDLFNYIVSKKLEELIILGHSLGGKTAMEFAVAHPSLVKKLVVVDISPKFWVELKIKMIGINFNLWGVNKRDVVLPKYRIL